MDPVAAAENLADQVFRPMAATVDAGWVPRSHLAELGRAGLLDLRTAPAATVRRVHEVLAGADLSTWLVQAQHHGPLRRLSDQLDGGAGDHRALVADLASGRRVAGVAFSQLRRWPQRPLTARRQGSDWVLNGTVPWYTGWGVNDVMVISAVDEVGQVVHGLVDLSGEAARAALTASQPLAVTATRAARTVSLQVSELVLTEADQLGQERIEDWLRADAETRADSPPAVFGVTDAALQVLRASVAGADPHTADLALDAAERIEHRVHEVRSEAYARADARGGRSDASAREDDAAAADREERLALRAQAQQLMIQATTAAVIAGGGRGVLSGTAAERHSREALFLLVQAQTSAVRAAALSHWRQL